MTKLYTDYLFNLKTDGESAGMTANIYALGLGALLRLASRFQVRIITDSGR